MPEIISESLPLWVELLLFAILSLSLCTWTGRCFSLPSSCARCFGSVESSFWLPGPRVAVTMVYATHVRTIDVSLTTTMKRSTDCCIIAARGI
jgi:hypothetical protein